MSERSGSVRDEVFSAGERSGSAREGKSRGSGARTLLLVVVIAVMAWLALTVRLPDLPELRERIEGFGWAAGPVFIALYAAVALTPIPVSVMALVGGVLFGVLEGSLLSIVGVMIGCWGAYWIARAAGREPIMRLLGGRGRRVEERLEDGGPAAVFTARVVPGLPYWPVNYGAGAFGVPQREYLLASLAACIPGQVSLVAIGHLLADPGWGIAIVVGLSWACVIAMTIWGYRRLRRTRDS
ncbi:TVP38/TMEM64 family protein [Brachybacterium sp. JHP9]|uniref:TVP38/TMEM64 family membrane protein n=1 Tax=Brachybacterium equifaecis TaxID=2910770 RepID=A0ABT0R2A9_9MICO|nr:TVP38/TMEM64 family protein [Brachybacterium equifaecis]